MTGSPTNLPKSGTSTSASASRDYAAIEFFDGPHTIHGVGTFQFLYKHLKWSSW